MKRTDLFKCFKKILEGKSLFLITLLFAHFTIMNAQTTKEEIESLSVKCNGKDTEACAQLLNIIKTDKDLDIRFFALNKLNDQNLIAEVVRTVPHMKVNDSALSKISDQEILYNMVMDKNTKNVYAIIRIIKQIKDEKLLINIIQNDSTYEVVDAALENINDQKFLFSIATNDKYYKNHHYDAIRKLTNEKDLFYIAENGNEKDRSIAIQQINDQKFLIKVLKSDKSRGVQQNAIIRITDQKFLNDFIKNSTDNYFSELAIKNITDLTYLMDLINTSSNDYHRELAIRQITDEKTLSEIAFNDSNLYAREIAVGLIKDQQLLKDIYVKSDILSIREKALNRLKHIDNPTYYKLLFQDKLLVINDKLYDKFCPSRNVKTKAVIKESKIGGRAEIYNNNFLFWCDDAEHTYIGHNENIRDVFSVVESDIKDPLVFRIWQKGYQYQSGKGFLIIKSKETHKELAYKWEGTLSIKGYDVKISFTSDRKINLISNIIVTVLDKKKRSATVKQIQTDTSNALYHTTVLNTNGKGVVTIEFGESIAFLGDAPFVYDVGDAGKFEGNFDRNMNNFTIVYNAPLEISFGESVINISGTWLIKKIN